MKLVGQMLELQRVLAAEKNPATKRQLAQRIASTDAQIDALVFALYELSAEEIALVQAG